MLPIKVVEEIQPVPTIGPGVSFHPSQLDQRVCDVLYAALGMQILNQRLQLALG